MWQFFSNSKKEDQPVTIPKGNPRIGKNIFFQECAGCHDFDTVSRLMEAPPLMGIIGKKIASTPYDYSRAFRNQKGIWTVQKMFLFLQRPSKMFPGNRMVYRGLKDRQKRAHLIAYLMTDET